MVNGHRKARNSFNLAIEMLVISGGVTIVTPTFSDICFNLAIEMLVISG